MTQSRPAFFGSLAAFCAAPLAWRKSKRQQVLDWLQEPNALTPAAKIAADLSQTWDTVPAVRTCVALGDIEIGDIVLIDSLGRVRTIRNAMELAGSTAISASKCGNGEPVAPLYFIAHQHDASYSA